MTTWTYRARAGVVGHDEAALSSILACLRAIKHVSADRPALAYNSHADFILAHGRAFTFAPNQEKPGMRGGCFMNAAKLAMDNPRRYFYVEGYATTADPVSPVQHAWVVTSAGIIVDNTWDHFEDQGRAYFGVPFSLTVLRRQLRRQGAYGLLIGPHFLIKPWRNTLSIPCASKPATSLTF